MVRAGCAFLEASLRSPGMIRERSCGWVIRALLRVIREPVTAAFDTGRVGGGAADGHVSRRCRAADGAGLAAPQIGVGLARGRVSDSKVTARYHPVGGRGAAGRFWINPAIEPPGRRRCRMDGEGCLSVAGAWRGAGASGSSASAIHRGHSTSGASHWKREVDGFFTRARGGAARNATTLDRDPVSDAGAANLRAFRIYRTYCSRASRCCRSSSPSRSRGSSVLPVAGLCLMRAFSPSRGLRRREFRRRPAPGPACRPRRPGVLRGALARRRGPATILPRTTNVRRRCQSGAPTVKRTLSAMRSPQQLVSLASAALHCVAGAPYRRQRSLPLRRARPNAPEQIRLALQAGAGRA